MNLTSEERGVPATRNRCRPDYCSVGPVLKFPHAADGIQWLVRTGESEFQKSLSGSTWLKHARWFRIECVADTALQLPGGLKQGEIMVMGD